ncbi:hypothetical protein HDU78_008252 [Chytriomyces hyalinus]|nr:hypothetical protein HDU78_008252 [Chytriomyces hyalinus]
MGDYCLGKDGIIDLQSHSCFRKGHPAIETDIKDFVRKQFGIDAISGIDTEYHAAALLPFKIDNERTYPQIRHMSEPEFSQLVLKPMLSVPFCREPMYWNSTGAPVFGSAHQRNQCLDPAINRIKLPHKADGIVRLQNFDSEGLEALILEVSGPQFNKDLMKHNEDFFKLGREMLDCWAHAVYKVQESGKSSKQLQEKLCIFGIQCWGYELEISALFQLYNQHWIAPLWKLKVPSVLKDMHQHLPAIEAAMLSIKVCSVTVNEWHIVKC